MAKAEIAIVELTNDFRRKHNLADVKPDPKLTNAARAFAEYLARTGKFAHDADAREPSERVRTAGYQYCYISENLALNQSSAGFETRDLARRMVEGWMNSPGHRKNLLAEHATDTAVAIARGPDKDPKFIAVQLFARPRTLSYEFQISNATSMPVRYRFGGEAHEAKPGIGIVHTACEPGDVTFIGAIRSATKETEVARFQARDGALFVIERAGASFKVDMRQKERLR